MGKCKKELYEDSTVVMHKPLMCYGGFGQPKCEWVKECFQENKLKLK